MAALLEHQSKRSILLRLDRGGDKAHQPLVRLDPCGDFVRHRFPTRVGRPDLDKGGIPKATSVRRDSCVLSCRQSFNNERLSLPVLLCGFSFTEHPDQLIVVPGEVRKYADDQH